MGPVRAWPVPRRSDARGAVRAAESVARPRRILDREVVFFGGKGGVGKTTLAATMALEAAREGHRTLLVSTDPAHSTSDVLDTRLGGEAREVRPRLWALEIDPAEEADRYIDDVKARIADSTPPRLMAEVERQIDIARVTPGAEESALFDRFTRIAEEAGDTWDRLIFDTAPLGHTLRLLALPELMDAPGSAASSPGAGRSTCSGACGATWRARRRAPRIPGKIRCSARSPNARPASAMRAP